MSEHGVNSPDQPAPDRRVIVFGIDGVRYDTLSSAATPVLDDIAEAGFLRSLRVNPAGPTISGPCWTTMATGVLPPKHQVFDNQLSGHQIERYPDFLTRVRALRPGTSTYVAANWPPIVRHDAGGPIFLGGGAIAVDEHPSQDLAAWEPAEERLVADAEEAVGRDDLAAAFIYLGSPDGYGHAVGVDPAYVGAIERSDERMGRVLDAVRRRPRYAEEKWTVIVVTDHGHLDAGGHGGDTVEERTAWIAASGPRIPTTPAELEQADVHAEVLRSLGIDIDPSWALDGRPFGTRTELEETVV